MLNCVRRLWMKNNQRENFSESLQASCCMCTAVLLVFHLNFIKIVHHFPNTKTLWFCWDEQRERLKKQLEKTKNQKEKLESLCRSLQAERKQSSIDSNNSDSVPSWILMNSAVYLKLILIMTIPNVLRMLCFCHALFTRNGKRDHHRITEYNSPSFDLSAFCTTEKLLVCISFTPNLEVGIDSVHFVIRIQKFLISSLHPLL